MKRIISAILSLLMVFGVFPVGIFVAGQTTSPESITPYATTSEFAGGSGASTDPYLISNKYHLNNVRNYPSAHFLMISDIVFEESDFATGGEFYNSGTGWEPIKTFTGMFDGGKHTIYGIKVYVPVSDSYKINYAGVFGYVSGATIQNLTTDKGSVYAYKNSFRLAYSGGIAAFCLNTTFLNCHNGNSVQGYNAGGIAGACHGGSFTNCTNLGSISESSEGSGLGGIVGTTSPNDDSYGIAIMSVTNCHNYGVVDGGDRDSGGIDSGGIIGFAASSKVTVEFCSNNGTISGGYAAGGIIGNSYNDTINHCYNNASVFGSTSGGIIGRNGYDYDDLSTITNSYNIGQISAKHRYFAEAGGISGTGGRISQCYSIGTLTAIADEREYTGAIAIYQGSTPIYISNCYASNAQSYTYSDGAILLSLDDMKNKSVYTGFDFEDTWGISKNVNNGYPYLKKNTTVTDSQMVSGMLGNINMGPYALNGATINVAGYEISLIDLEAKLTLNIGENIKIISNTNGMIKVLIGFDQDASANLSGEKNSTNYWSESYQEVKSMYQDLTGKKVDTTRLWNKFSSLRGKLRKNKASMIIDVNSSITGYAEFYVTSDGIIFSEGGVIAQFEANTSVRTYPYPFVFLSLGLGVNANGELVFVNENGKINPSISVDSSIKISAGGGIGTSSTYAEIDAYGTLMAKFSTNSDVPFKAGVDLGAQWRGFIIGKEIFSDSKSFASMELYPNFGNPWPVSLMCMDSGIDASYEDSYINLLDSSTQISRNYLASTYSLRSYLSTDGTDFLKRNAYPLSSPNLVRFDDDTMLLVWIDDTGEKTIENRCSLMYSFFDGTEWSIPATVYEDGMNADMPSVYSDGTYAYIVWQKATCVFDETIETSEMLKYYDLYSVVFDSQTQTFGEMIDINSDDDTVFEFSPVIYGLNGDYEIAWIENTDNNVYQMSGENSIHTVSIDVEGNMSESMKIINTYNTFKGIDICNSAVVYSIYESESNNLYSYDGSSKLIAEGINCFDCENGKIFYSDATGLHSYNGSVTHYSEMGCIDEFTVSYCNGKYALFTKVLNEDFSKSLYYATMPDSKSSWSNMELYYGIGTYIRDYSPVVLSDGSVHVAFNHVTFDPETDDETAMIQIGQCTDDVNISLEYVDFDDSQLSNGNIDLLINVSNHSSTNINSLDVIVEDNNGKVVYTKTLELPLDAFSNTEFSISYSIPDEYNDDIYIVKVIPTNYSDYDESDNEVSTTLQCVHVYSDNWVVGVYPSNGVDGSYVQKCQICGKTLEEKIIPCAKFCGASLTLKDNLTVSFKVEKSLLEDNGYSNPYVVFKLGNTETVINEYSVVDDMYVFEFSGVYPDKMNDTIFATLHASYLDHVCNTQTITYSIAEYCYNMLDQYSDDEYAEFRTLLVDLLNYGAASQEYTGYNTDNLSNSALSEKQMAWGTNETPILETIFDREYAVIGDATVTWKSAGLNLNNSIGMRFKIATDSIENLSVKVIGGLNEWEIPSSEFVETDGGYYIYFNGFGVAQMSEAVYLTVYDGDTVVSNTLRYSIESYAYAKQDSDDTALAELVIAMMKYGNAARVYVESKITDESYYTYTVNDGQATITGFDSSFVGRVEIPATLGGYPVVAIDSNAFKNCEGITEIIITESVSAIGDGAFNGCYGLTTVIVYGDLTQIGSYAFGICPNLTSVTIIGGVTTIRELAFHYATNLTTLILGSGTKEIYTCAFYGCDNLKNIYFAGTKTEWESIFISSDNYSLFSATIHYNYKLYKPDNSDKANELYFAYTVNGDQAAIAGFDKTYIGDVVIPSSIGGYSVTSIGYGAFSNCTGITNIKIPDSITTISYTAFENCTGLTKVDIPDSVTIMEGSVFSGCINLEEVVLSKNLTKIGHFSFDGCVKLRNIIIPESVTVIDFRTFSNCSSLTSIEIPSRVTEIQMWAFMGCNNLISVIIPESVTSIDNNAFYECSSYITIYCYAGSYAERYAIENSITYKTITNNNQ